MDRCRQPRWLSRKSRSVFVEARSPPSPRRDNAARFLAICNAVCGSSSGVNRLCTCFAVRGKSPKSIRACSTAVDDVTKIVLLIKRERSRCLFLFPSLYPPSISLCRAHNTHTLSSSISASFLFPAFVHPFILSFPLCSFLLLLLSLFFLRTHNNVAAVQNQIISDARARRGKLCGSSWNRKRRLGIVSNELALSPVYFFQKLSVGAQVCRTCPSWSARARLCAHATRGHAYTHTHARTPTSGAYARSARERSRRGAHMHARAHVRIAFSDLSEEESGELRTRKRIR